MSVFRLEPVRTSYGAPATLCLRVHRIADHIGEHIPMLAVDHVFLPSPGLQLKERMTMGSCGEWLQNRLAAVGKVVGGQEAAVTKPLQLQFTVGVTSIRLGVTDY